jgi:DNA-binding transcriptional MocR family regulator
VSGDASPPPFEAGLERLLGPFVGALAEPTSLSPLPYDLNAGVPDPDSLPVEAIAAALERVLRADPAGALTYGGAQGYEPLRAWIADRESEASGLALGPEHVTLCSGSAHAIDNIAATFLGPGDVAVLGAPAYPGAIRAFRARGARVVDVPQDALGLRVDLLDAALDRVRAEGATAKLIYLVATYDNPSGTTLPLERREALVELARRHGVLIVEDDAYAGLDFEGPPPASLFAIAGGRGVLRAGTASKTVATGLRVGWIVAEPEAIRRLVFTRLDNGSSPLLLRALLAYYEGGTHEAHLERVRALYRERRDAAAAAARAAFGELAAFELPAGGFYLWLRLANGIAASELAAAAQQRGVAVTAGSMYAADGRDERHIRLAYPTLPPAALREAIALLGAACAEAAASAARR